MTTALAGLSWLFSSAAIQPVIMAQRAHEKVFCPEILLGIGETLQKNQKLQPTRKIHGKWYNGLTKPQRMELAKFNDAWARRFLVEMHGWKDEDIGLCVESVVQAFCPSFRGWYSFKKRLG